MKEINLMVVGMICNACFPVLGWSADPPPLSIPHHFVAGTPARAAEMNENFTAVEAGVNSNQALVNQTRSNITGIQQRLLQDESNIDQNQLQITDNANAIGALNDSAAAATSRYGANVFDFTSTQTNIDSLTVNVPGAGTVLFNVTGFMGTRAHTNGTRDQIYCALYDSSNNLLSMAYMVVPEALPTYSNQVFAVPLAISRAMQVSSVGAITVNLNCTIQSGGGGLMAFVDHYQIQAVYVPNSL